MTQTSDYAALQARYDLLERLLNKERCYEALKTAEGDIKIIAKALEKIRKQIPHIVLPDSPDHDTHCWGCLIDRIYEESVVQEVLTNAGPTDIVGDDEPERTESPESTRQEASTKAKPKDGGK